MEMPFWDASRLSIGAWPHFSKLSNKQKQKSFYNREHNLVTHNDKSQFNRLSFSTKEENQFVKHFLIQEGHWNQIENEWYFTANTSRPKCGHLIIYLNIFLCVNDASPPFSSVECILDLGENLNLLKHKHPSRKLIQKRSGMRF